FGVVDVLLNRTRERRGERILVASELLVVLMEGSFANVAVGGNEEFREGRIRQFDLLSFFVLEHAEFHVSVEQLPKRLARRASHLPLHREYFFLTCAERVRL